MFRDTYFVIIDACNYVRFVRTEETRFFLINLEIGGAKHWCMCVDV